MSRGRPPASFPRPFGRHLSSPPPVGALAPPGPSWPCPKSPLGREKVEPLFGQLLLRLLLLSYRNNLKHQEVGPILRLKSVSIYIENIEAVGRFLECLELHGYDKQSGFCNKNGWVGQYFASHPDNLDEHSSGKVQYNNCNIISCNIQMIQIIQ